ncbi:thymidylate kinase [Melioribacter roseus P3M-2]|uniref:Thymidylate kinase n=1 Tax=Melioribacter roseus (strain DSM 23840 / JCM 17771 / VKM B-2668 / P3M-2) TaxID=1191523 RepID=I7A1N0_MELRP|nr:dTMP kinase [Melioribacter roseus]AFN75133.1 thymidylate kinase [Melioribacter roseus P3M-2]
MFITFEGLDFCGKSTQVKLLKEYLENKNEKVLVIREPGGTDISESIRSILLDKKNIGMCDETELLLFSASRAQLVKEKILPALEKNIWVISDRFHDSTIAYQSYGRGLPGDFVEKLQSFVIGQAVPALTFFIDLPVEEVFRRMSIVKKHELDRIETSQREFYENVRKGYLQLSQKEKRFRKIDGMLTIEEIHKVIIEEIEKKIRVEA